MTDLLTRRLFAVAATGSLISAASRASAAPRPGGGRPSIDHARRGKGAPAIVLISGLGDDYDAWRGLVGACAARSETIAFNRPGYGRSLPTDAPRDAETIAGETRAFLAGIGVSPPYLLVAHSLGGAYAQVFARQYPLETAGLVLVDTVVPGQTRLVRQVAPDLYGLVSGMMRLRGGAVLREYEAADLSERQIEAHPVYRGPVILLAATGQGEPTPRAFADARRARMLTLAEAYGGDYRPVRSGHYIHHEAPGAVIAAIEDCLRRARHP